MRKLWMPLTTVALLIGCAPAPEAPKNPRDAAQSQAELSTDERQARLWEQAAASGAAEGTEALIVSGPAVRQREPVVVPERKIEPGRRAYPETVRNAVAVVSTLELERPWTGPVRVDAVDGEFLTLKLDEVGALMLQVKVRDAPLRATRDEIGQLYYRAGDPFARNDVLALKLKDDDLVYALVGGASPVSLKVEAFGLAASQVGELKGNTMAVRLSAFGETYTVNAGEQAVFRKGGLTVEVAASVAVQGESAHALPGEPYRIELVGWRSR